MYKKLSLLGHIHNRPNEKITWTYSWPLGVSFAVIEDHISRFERAFTLINVEY